ncbi:MAG: NADH-quinone oxidoreductase subunit J [Hyphomonadaceae bacterium]
MDLIAFYILAGFVTVAALGVIVSRNPVHSVLFLILAFLASAGLLVLIGAEFLAMLLIVVYVGAVAVLFLFVVMMLDVDFVELKQGTLGYWPLGLIAGGLMFGEIALVTFARGSVIENGSFDPSPGAETNAEAIGAVMYSDYLLLFQLAGIVLLLAMIGAIVLTLRGKTSVKRQDIGKQVARTRDEAFELVDVQPGEGI